MNLVNNELVLERVFDATTLANTRITIKSVSKYFNVTLQLSGTLVTKKKIALAQKVFTAWKSHKLVRISSWTRRRVRNDETPILTCS